MNNIRRERSDPQASLRAKRLPLSEGLRESGSVPRFPPQKEICLDRASDLPVYYDPNDFDEVTSKFERPEIPEDAPTRRINEKPQKELVAMTVSDPSQRRSTFPPKGELDLIGAIQSKLEGAQVTSMKKFDLNMFLVNISTAEVILEMDEKRQNGHIRVEHFNGRRYDLFINPSDARLLSGMKAENMTILNVGTTLFCLFPCR